MRFKNFRNSFSSKNSVLTNSESFNIFVRKFFPQEDKNQLNQLKGQLTPFLKAVTKALSAELEVGFDRHKMNEPILDEIIQNIPSENSTPITISPSTQTIDTESFIT